MADLGAGGQSRPTVLLYVSLDGTRSLVGEALSSTDVATYRREVLPFLTPLHAMTLASSVGADGSQSVALFVGIR